MRIALSEEGRRLPLDEFRCVNERPFENQVLAAGKSSRCGGGRTWKGRSGNGAC
jgi:hypothetical protein